jgi:hypothetical protein
MHFLVCIVDQQNKGIGLQLGNEMKEDAFEIAQENLEDYFIPYRYTNRADRRPPKRQRRSSSTLYFSKKKSRAIVVTPASASVSGSVKF